MSAFYRPPKENFNKKSNDFEIIQPFYAIIKDIQAFRRDFPKGHINNLLYTEMGNSIYGNVVRGMSDKKSFDVKTGNTIRITGTELSNPILASWTTALIRSVIGECLHNIRKLGGQIVSVTTDGFITDIENLEAKLLDLPEEDTLLLRKYKELRFDLSDCNDALELKSCSKGVISWTTSGHLGLGSDKIVASTGFQRGDYSREELIELFSATLKSP